MCTGCMITELKHINMHFKLHDYWPKRSKIDLKREPRMSTITFNQEFLFGILHFSFLEVLTSNGVAPSFPVFH